MSLRRLGIVFRTELAFQARRPMTWILVLLTVLPLFWRRRAPFLVLLATLAPSLGLAALGYGVHAHVAPAVALYSYAARPARGPIWPVVAVAVVGYAALVVVEAITVPFDLEDYLIPILIWGGAWLVGDRRRVVLLRAAEEQAVRAALAHTGGRKGAAATLLGISWPTLNRKIREYGLDRETPAD